MCLARGGLWGAVFHEEGSECVPGCMCSCWLARWGLCPITVTWGQLGAHPRGRIRGCLIPSHVPISSQGTRALWVSLSCSMAPPLALSTATSPPATRRRHGEHLHPGLGWERAVAPVPVSVIPHPCVPCFRRNQNYLDILRLLSLGDKQLSSFDISLRFTHLFWFGDLNYRLDMDIQVWERAWGCQGLPPSPVPAPLSPQEILNYISRKELEPLLKVDQLNLEKEKHKVFLRFGEDWGAPGGSGGATPAVGTVLTHCCPCR